IRGIGGCCGTTPDHVKQIGQAARMLRRDVPPRDSSPPEIANGSATRDFEQMSPPCAPGIRVTPLEDKGELGSKLAAKKFVISVEVNPPAGLSLDKALEGARVLKEGGVDV